MKYVRPEQPEGLIIKSAILYDDQIFTGIRHLHIMQDIMQDIMDEFGYEEGGVQGFVTENGFFLTRIQAHSYGEMIGQIVDNLIGPVLTSEDLWDIHGNHIKGKNGHKSL